MRYKERRCSFHNLKVQSEGESADVEAIASHPDNSARIVDGGDTNKHILSVDLWILSILMFNV